MKIHSHMSRTLLCLLAGCTLLSGCRSTLFHAARRGDFATVANEINKGADARNDPSPAAALWILPVGLLSIPADILTFRPLYADNTFTGNAFRYYTQSPAEVAYDLGHSDIAGLLMLKGSPIPTQKGDSMIAGYDWKKLQQQGYDTSNMILASHYMPVEYKRSLPKPPKPLPTGTDISKPGE